MPPAALSSAFLLGLRFATFDHGELRHSHAECFADLRLDLRSEVAVLMQKGFRVLASLTDAHIAVGEPRARLLDDAMLEADIDQLAGLGDAFAVRDVEFGLAERSGAFVLDH